MIGCMLADVASTSSITEGICLVHMLSLTSIGAALVPHVFAAVASMSAICEFVLLLNVMLYIDCCSRPLLSFGYQACTERLPAHHL